MSFIYVNINIKITKLIVKAILEKATKHDWSLQGFGMSRRSLERWF